MKIVQVTSEAKARPIITALTRISADRNIDHGDNSWSTAVEDFNDRAALSAVVASMSAAVCGTATGATGDCTTAAAAGEGGSTG
jgi:hypothetical protein